MDQKLLAWKTAVTAFFSAMGMMLGWKGIMVLTWVVLMAMDYITGTLGAMKEGAWCSKKAREGAWHKCGAMIVVMVGNSASDPGLVYPDRTGEHSGECHPSGRQSPGLAGRTFGSGTPHDRRGRKVGR